ncbi:hypothetical protein ScPMuIL_016264 [Solemya velum]
MAAKVNVLTLVVLFTLFETICCATTLDPPTTVPTTPPVPIVTTQQSTITATPSPVQANTDIAPCPCDLTGLGCDINCCCDEDCSADDIAAFNCLPSSFSNVDEWSCFQENLFLDDNTAYTTKVTNHGLFCIYYDNKADRNYYTIPEVITTAETFNNYLSQYADKTFMPQSAAPTVYGEFYKAGDPVYIVYENLVQGVLRLPSPLGSSVCTDSNPTAFLHDQSFQCIRDIDLQADCQTVSFLNAANFIDGFKVVKTPSLFNLYTNRSENTQNDNVFNNTMTVVPTAAAVHLCRNSAGLTSVCTTNEIRSPTFNNVTNTCDNAVVQVNYMVVYQGTDGISSLEIQFTFASVGATNLPLVQEYRATYNKPNENDTVQRSGNPGYVIGEPIMAGVLDTNSSKQSINLNGNRNQWMTVVKASADGNCFNDSDDRSPVLFGVSMRSGCLLPFSLDNMTSAGFCQATQNAILLALEGTVSETIDRIRVATFGNSDPEKVGDWVSIVVSNKPSGTATSSITQSGPICELVMGMHIQIIYANVGSLANPQPKILGVSYIYNEREDVGFTCIGAYCQLGTTAMSQGYEVSQSVSFLDISQPAVGYVGEAPIFLAKVPYDFFYPFLTAASARFSCNIAVVLTFVLISSVRNCL